MLQILFYGGFVLLLVFISTIVTLIENRRIAALPLVTMDEIRAAERAHERHRAVRAALRSQLEDASTAAEYASIHVKIDALDPGPHPEHLKALLDRQLDLRAA